jgi:hypothetical protein
MGHAPGMLPARIRRPHEHKAASRCETVHPVCAADLRLLRVPVQGLNRRRTMISLLIGVGALFLAVIVCAIFDPWPSPADNADGAGDGMPTLDAIVLAV